MSGMRHRRFVVASVDIDGDDARLRYGDLLVASGESTDELDWECVLLTVDPEPVPHGAHHIAVVTLEGRSIGGDAILVRSIDGTHVFRGAGTIDGIEPSELH